MKLDNNNNENNNIKSNESKATSTNKHNLSFDEILKKAKRKKILLWTTTPILIGGSLAGTIYFVYKNNISYEKESISLKQFEKLCNNVELYSAWDVAQKASEIIDSYNFSKQNKLFDINDFINLYIKNNIDFNTGKKILLNYLDLELSKDKNENKLDITFEITLNKNFIKGELDAKKNKKYYKKITKTVVINEYAENFNTEEFKKLWSEKYDAEIKAILRKRAPGEEITDQNGTKWFASETFRKEVWDWILKIFKEAKIFPDIYPEDKYDIFPYIPEFYENEKSGLNNEIINPYPNPDSTNPDILNKYKLNEYAYVNWNNKKNLNYLTIDYIYHSKTSITKSKPRRIILTIVGI